MPPGRAPARESWLVMARDNTVLRLPGVSAEETPALSEPRRGESKMPIDEMPVPPLTDEEDTMGG